ncbi:HNH endonuclease [Moritella viscosa]|uniref:HNH endonuclease n=1 Tax=Moritella viscosa TaxID=80854 RepID=A0A1L0ALA3_9GAMM|nr:HNH endonuclease [Moritella viscosa]SGZ17446.1 HNH endonuclease [Moritella viscosa]
MASKERYGKVIEPYIYNNKLVQDNFIRHVELDETTPKNIIDIMGKCWVMPNRMVSQKGYIRRTFSNVKRGTKRTEIISTTAYIHRMSYSIFVKTIPEHDKLTGQDNTIDHRCGNRGCCNPDHLQMVLRGENSRLMHQEKDEHRKNDHIKANNQLNVILDIIEHDNKATFENVYFIFDGSREVIKSVNSDDWFNDV